MIPPHPWIPYRKLKNIYKFYAQINRKYWIIGTSAYSDERLDLAPSSHDPDGVVLETEALGDSSTYMDSLKKI